MLITSDNILATIQKMVTAGKQLPQMDRIKFSKNPTEERQKVLAETVTLWWELFGKQKIGVERWEKATEKAMMISGIPRLETQIINPQLMSVALQKVEEEYTAEQIAENAKRKTENVLNYKPVDFPEGMELLKWHLKHHKKPLLDLPTPDFIRSWTKGKYADEDVERNMTQLRVYFCFCQHAHRDKEKMPLEMTLDENRMLRIRIVDKTA